MKEQIKNTKKVSKKKKANKNRISMFTLLFVLGLLLIVIFLCTMVSWITKSIKYSSYTEQMNHYGYNELYSNGKATAFQKVTNIDMLKVVIGSINNTTNVSEVSLVAGADNMEENKVWYETAKVLGITNNITEKKLKSKAKEIDAVIAVIRVLEEMLQVELKETKLQISEKALKNYSSIERSCISKAVTLGILENNDKAISNSKLIKGELNKLVMEVANRYATVHYDTFDLDENGNIIKNDVHVVTDKDKLPKNYKEYPYVVNNIEKSIYELEFNVINEDSFKEPRAVYETMGDLYSQIDETISGYFKTLLNINYKTINENEFAEILGSYTIYGLGRGEVFSYIDYVRNNEIVLQGNARPLLPIIYNDGEQYIVRTEITFEVVNSKTDTNLLYGDENYKVKYNGKEITMYVDVPMGITFNSNSLLMDVNCNAKHMVKENTNVVIEK